MFNPETSSTPLLTISKYYNLDSNMIYLYAQVVLKRLRNPFTMNVDPIDFNPHEHAAIHYFEAQDDGDEDDESEFYSRIHISRIALNQHYWTSKEVPKMYEFSIGINPIGIRLGKESVTVRAGSIEQALEDAKESMNMWATNAFIPVFEDWQFKFVSCTVEG